MKASGGKLESWHAASSGQEDRSILCYPKMVILFFSVSQSITDRRTISSIFSDTKKQASALIACENHLRSFKNAAAQDPSIEPLHQGTKNESWASH